MLLVSDYLLKEIDVVRANLGHVHITVLREKPIHRFLVTKLLLDLVDVDLGQLCWDLVHKSGVP